MERFLLARVYGPVPYGDTQTYFRLARVLSESSLSGYDATRVPGYPAFVAILGMDESRIMTTQLILGVLTSLLLYFIMLRLTGSPGLAFAAGAAYDLIGSQLLFEFNLLSESLTTFLFVSTLAGFVWLQGREGGRTRWIAALGLGVLSSLTGMARTLFFTLPVFLLLFVTGQGGSWTQRIRLGAFFSVGPLLILGGWIFFVYSHYGMISPSTMGGYHLVQHTGSYFERLPGEESLIRDIYLKYRDEQIAEKGNQTNAIWDAIPELSQRTGLSFFALSSKLQELSLDLIRQYPHLYLRSVIEGWVTFWKAPVYWKPDHLRAPIADAINVSNWAGRVLSLLANASFLALSLAVIGWRRLRKKLSPPRFIAMTSGFILAVSVIQTLVDHGDNPRFLVPLQAVVILIVLWAGHALIAELGQGDTKLG
jgi:4-amino-4-deoxy-L-arabinose transferase-like glycosyltransferase